MRTGQVIGLPITIGSSENIAQKIVRDVSIGHGGYVCVANVHMVTTAWRDQKLHKIIENSNIVTADGFPLVLALKQGGYTQAKRVTGTDLTLKLCEIASVKKIPIYFYGGSSKTIKTLKTYFKDNFPNLNIVGYESPPLLPEEPPVNTKVVSRIQESGSKIVFVGLGCPKQEFWMASYTPHLSSILIGVGAAFDFIAGTAKRAPLWMQKLGLEWLHRLVTQPRRTWKRYATTNPLFLWLIFKEYFNSKHP